jgi:prevent-host-death family protein
MRIIEKAKATAPLAKYMTRVKEEPVIVTRKGKPIAALVSIENADLETVSLSTNRKFLALIERSRARHRTEGGISSDEMRRRLGVKRKKRA